MLDEQCAHAPAVQAFRGSDGQVGRSSLVALFVLGEAHDPAL
ncbi:hypothetical protein ACWDBT_31420 [Streptomyces ardesiacus]